MTVSGNYLLEVPMGYGSVNFETVFSMLLRQGYDGWFSSESAPLGDAEAVEIGIRNVRRYYENARRMAAIQTGGVMLTAD